MMHCVLVFLVYTHKCNFRNVLVCIHRLQAGQHQVYDAGRHVEEDSALQYCDPPRGLHHQSFWRPLYEYGFFFFEVCEHVLTIVLHSFRF